MKIEPLLYLKNKPKTIVHRWILVAPILCQNFVAFISTDLSANLS